MRENIAPFSLPEEENLRNISGRNGGAFPEKTAEKSAEFPAEKTGGEVPPVGAEQIAEWNRLLAKYRAGKRALDRRVQAAENWWTLRNRFEEQRLTDPKSGGFRAGTSWLHNVITSKHADAVAAYPVPNLLPRGEEDRPTAELLTRILPVVLKQNRFEEVYDMASWQKLKTGTGVYKVIWDRGKLNGLGDISITRRDILSLFWEPGICDIQDSRCVFDVELTDRETAEREVRRCAGRDGAALSSVFRPETVPPPDGPRQEDRVPLIDVYYKKDGVLHYCKYAGDTVLYATENDPARRERGLYDHGLYPFVFDVLFPVEGSPAGYGYVDICANAQTRIDLLSTALLRNTLAAATPRYFQRSDGGINEEELLNLENAVIHVTGNLGEDSIRTMPVQGLSPSHLSVLTSTIQELRETSGNTETSTGGISGGVTAAAAIAALQDAAGKGSRAAIQASYRAYTGIVNLVIELIRQFYDAPRQFRIIGPAGTAEFVSFSGQELRLQRREGTAGLEESWYLPVYDIDVEPEKKSAYTKLAQNELALQFYNAGFFNPQLAPQALMAIDMMDFEGREAVRSAIMRGAAP